MEASVNQVKLPMPARLNRITLQHSDVLRTSGRVFKRFYYMLEIGAVRFQKQTCVPRVPLSRFEELEKRSVGLWR